MYHNVTAPAIRKTKKLFGKAVDVLKKRANARRGVGTASNPARKAAVQAKTRGTTAGNGRLWSKNTVSGIKRRKAAAAQAKLTPRPKRTHNAPKATTAPQTATRASQPASKPSPAKVALVRSTKPGSVAATVHTSKTHGQLRRKLAGQAVRSVTKSVSIPKSNKTARKQRADDIRGIRNTYGAKVLQSRVKSEKAKRLKEAASEIAKHSKKP